MTINVNCGPSGAVITGETEDELVSNMQAHARAHDEPNRPASAAVALTAGP
jgi:hypothetical protein